MGTRSLNIPRPPVGHGGTLARLAAVDPASGVKLAAIRATAAQNERQTWHVRKVSRV